MKELEECTFKPRTNHAAKAKPVNGSNDENKAQEGGYMSQHNAKKSKAPVVVRGLGRYLELKKLAAQKAAAQDARERKVRRGKILLRCVCVCGTIKFSTNRNLFLRLLTLEDKVIKRSIPMVLRRLKSLG